MKNSKLINLFICAYFLLLNTCLFAQQKVIREISSNLTDITLNTTGLDHITIRNSENNQMMITLLDEASNNHHVLIKEEGTTVIVNFKLERLLEQGNGEVFRKFITKRLHRVNAILYLPKDKNLLVLGTHVDIQSYSYHGTQKIAIDKGEVNVHRVVDDIDIRLYDGNVFAKVDTLTSFSIISNHGNIAINDTKLKKKYTKKTLNANKTFKVSSVQANIILINKYE